MSEFDDEDRENQFSEERADIMRYGRAVAAERAAYHAVLAWHDLYSRCRPSMEDMHPGSAAGLHHALKAAEQDAMAVHQAAESVLRNGPNSRVAFNLKHHTDIRQDPGSPD